jgi:uncharacterized protein
MLFGLFVRIKTYSHGTKHIVDEQTEAKGMPTAFIHPVNMATSSERGGVILGGASGMLGTALRISLAGGHTPTLQLVRGNASAEGQIHWDPTKPLPASESGRLEGFSAAIHLGGANLADRRWTPAYRQELWTSRVDSTRALAITFAALRRPPQCLLVASAVGFYGDRGEELLIESSSAGSGFLADLCREWEAAAEPAVNAGIRVVYLRTGVVLGRGHGALERMLPPFRFGLGGKLGNGKQWMSWISLADAIAGILFALGTATIAGPVNLTSPNPVTNAEFTRALGRQLGRPAVLGIPSFALRLALGTMADEALLASTRAVPAKLQAAGFQFAHPAIDEALSAVLS